MRCQIVNVKQSGSSYEYTVVPEGQKKTGSLTVTSSTRYFMGAWIYVSGSSITGLA